jgi:hypothetical protein
MGNSISETYRGFEVSCSATRLADDQWSVKSVIRPVTPDAIAVAAPRTEFGAETISQGSMEACLNDEMKDARHFVDVLLDPIDLSSTD